MKSPSDSTDPSGQQDPSKSMNAERRTSWQGQYQFNHPSQPPQFQDGQAAPRPPYYPEKPDMYGTQPGYRASPTTDPNTWQGAPMPHSGGMDRYGAPEQVSPAHPSGNSQYRDSTPNAVNSNGMSAAAAAAAAAMAAAAHTAKASPGYAKPTNTVPPPQNMMPGKPMPVPVQQRSVPPFHPNYTNVQQTSVPPQNLPPQDPGMQNHSTQYQPAPGPPMNRPMTTPQYPPQWGPTQPNSMDYRQGYQPGYEPQPMPATNERIPSYTSDSMSGPMSNASSHDSEESRSKSIPSARSSSQKISALYEPDEPGRKDFIDRILRYWEEKELPLKHAPMMGGRTLDLYTLYQHVKKKGFYQEVTRTKEWSEISSAMGLGSTSATGFTLKKQYGKYLYGFECQFERNEPEPQEALARIIEANRKKKQVADQNQAKNAENTPHDGHNMMHHPQHPYPGHHPEYRPVHPMGYPPRPMPPNMHPGYTPARHNHSVPHMPSSYEQQQRYPPMGWQQPPHYPPQRPPTHPRYQYRSNGLPQPPPKLSPGPQYMTQTNNYDQMQHASPRPPFNQAPQIPTPMPPQQKHQQPPPILPPQPVETPQLPRNNSIQSPEPTASTTTDTNLEIQRTPPVPQEKDVPPTSAPIESQPQTTGPVSTTIAPTPTSEPIPASAENTAPTPSSTTITSTAEPVKTEPASNALPTEAQLVAPSVPNQQQPNQPGNTNSQPSNDIAHIAPPSNMVPGPPNNLLKTLDQRQVNDPNIPKPRMMPMVSPQFRGPAVRPYPHNNTNMGPQYHPHRPPERPPMAPGGMYQPPYHQTYPPYHAANSQPNDSGYYGQKRPTMEQYGPPNKVPRADLYMQYRENYDRRRSLADGGRAPHHYQPYPPGMMHQSPSIGNRHHPPPPPHHQSFPNTVRHNMSMMRMSSSPAGMSMHAPDGPKPRPHLPGPSPDSASKFLQGLASAPPPRPQGSVHHQHSSSSHMSSGFPQGTVEAVVPAFIKPGLKTGREMGVVEAWQIIMALKSGLHAESTWALNALTILLHDKSTVGQVVLTQLPGLLHSIIEHYRYCLHQMFGMFEDVSKVEEDGANQLGAEETETEQATTDLLSKCNASTTNLTLGGKQHKYLPAPDGLQNPHNKRPVKVIGEENKYRLLLDVMWGKEQKPTTSDFLPIPGFKNEDKKLFADDTKPNSNLSSEVKIDSDVAAELTFEDMLSIPSFIRCLAQSKVVQFDYDEKEELDDDVTIFPEEKKLRNHPEVNNTDKDKKIDIVKTPVSDSKLESKLNILQKEKEGAGSTDDNMSHIQSCLGHFIWNCNVALLEEEAAGFPGNSGFKAPSGVNNWRLITRGLEYVFPKKPDSKQNELILRILCLSNLIRSLSCAIANHNEILSRKEFFRSLTGTLLLGHKHRIRHVRTLNDVKEPSVLSNDEKLLKLCGRRLDSYFNRSALIFSPKVNEITENRPLEKDSTENAVINNGAGVTTTNNINQSKNNGEKHHNGTNHKTLDDGDLCDPSTDLENMTFSTTVLRSSLQDRDDNYYNDPWWWESIRQLREDSLVTLVNLSPSLDLSLVWDDNIVSTMLDACLHWAVCPSADARDPFPSTNPRTFISAQSLSIEILTKLSMKEANVDLILATRPYGRLEKLYKNLTIMIGNRKDQTLRELSIVLLSNLCREETAARAVALQTGSVSNFLSFLEECEETGISNQRMFPANQGFNCGTVSYMMQRCALTLLRLAKLEENRPLFLKHHLRLLSLSMSVLGSAVQSIISSVLFELSREPPNR